MIRRFTKAQRSTFHYWYYHWACFNLLAKKLGVWKFKFLFHDIEKPFLKLFLPYPKVKKWHREHNDHHLAYGFKHGFDKMDWLAVALDWECSRFSKKEAQLNAYETMMRYKEKGEFDKYYICEAHLLPILKKLNLNKRKK